MSDAEAIDLLSSGSGSESDSEKQAGTSGKARGRKKSKQKPASSGDAQENEAWWKKPLTELPDFESDEEEDEPIPQREQPLGLVTQLLPFQRESLHWMSEQERTAMRGGILADEMGLGKTVQTIAMILAHKEDSVDPLAPPTHGPEPYESEGCRKMREAADKEAAKAAKAAKRSAAAAEKEAKAAARAAAKDAKAAAKDAKAAAKEAKAAAKEAAKVAATEGKSPGKGKGKAKAPSPQIPAASPITAVAQQLASSKLATSPAAAGGGMGDDDTESEGDEPVRLSAAPASACASASASAHSTASAAASAAATAASSAASSCGHVHADPAAGWKPLQPATTELDRLAAGRPMCTTTLVLCPVIALTQWRAEIYRHCAPGALKVHIYHGPDRTTDVDFLESQDVVLTTYSVLEAEWRKMMAPNKQACKWCGKLLQPEKMAVHLRYFCGPDAQKTAAQAKQQRTRDGGSGGGKGKASKAKLQEEGEEDEEEVVVEVEDTEDEEQETEAVSTPKSKGKSKSTSKASGSKGRSGGRSPASSRGSRTPLSGTKRKRKAEDDDDDDDDDDGDDSDYDSGAEQDANADTEDEDEDDYADEDEEGSGEERYTPRPTRRRSGGSGSGSASGGAGGSSAAAPPPARKPLKLGPISILQRVHWLRVVLDEAHAIKNKRSNTARAALALTAHYRWCLSGTPLQNRVTELFSMIRFLRIHYASYYCKNCPCQAMDYQISPDGRACNVCGHSPLRHYNWLNRYVANPIRRWGYAGPGKDAMQLLRTAVLKGLVLRRTKAGRAADLSLPTRTILLRNDLELDPFERDFYEAMYTQSQARFGTFVQAGTVLQNYAHIFDLLTRLRQAVNHPYLILNGRREESAAEAASAGAGSVYASSATDVCGICREPAEDAVVTGCRHVFCRLCMREYLDSLGGRATGLLRDATNDESAFVGIGEEDEEGGGSEDEEDADVDEEMGGSGGSKRKASKGKKAAGGKKGRAGKQRPAPSPVVPDDGLSSAPVAAPECPKCLAPLTVNLQPSAEASGAGVSAAARRKSILARIPADRVGAAFRSSTKIEALLEDLWRASAEEPGCKAIVFSQFVNMLELIEHRLTHAGIRCVRLDGSLSVAARDRVITAFRTDPHVTVILISLKAGGVALNLTPASRLYLCDPWWNPAAEMQAIDRTHRLGQHRSITAVRFIVRGTIEERILALQEKKRLVFEGTVGADSGSLARLTDEDMRFLFQ